MLLNNDTNDKKQTLPSIGKNLGEIQHRFDVG